MVRVLSINNDKYFQNHAAWFRLILITLEVDYTERVVENYDGYTTFRSFYVDRRNLKKVNKAYGIANYEASDLDPETLTEEYLQNLKKRVEEGVAR